jgi:hypothetical protein
MQPVRQIGPTIAVGSGATAAIQVAASVVLVSNAGAAMAYFTAQANGNTPTSAIGVPVPAGGQITIGIPANAQFYGAYDGALNVTPVEMMRTQ